jgi:hypothetical protein
VRVHGLKGGYARLVLQRQNKSGGGYWRFRVQGRTLLVSRHVGSRAIRSANHYNGLNHVRLCQLDHRRTASGASWATQSETRKPCPPLRMWLVLAATHRLVQDAISVGGDAPLLAAVIPVALTVKLVSGREGNGLLLEPEESTFRPPRRAELVSGQQPLQGLRGEAWGT